MSLFQVPVDVILGGVYSWTLRLSDKTVTGSVVVRGPDAGPIGNYEFPANSETWYHDAVQQQTNESASFELKLVLMAQPSDSTLQSLVGQVTAGTKMGEVAMTPTWKEGSPLPSSPTVFTMTAVKDGPGEYENLYSHVSMIMPVGEAPLMPTWYTDIQGLYSIFGGSEEGVPVANGTRGIFGAAGEEDPGYPGEGWYWTGRDPT